MPVQVDRVLAQRRELKFLVNEDSVAAIKRHMAPFMRPDEFTQGLEDRGYPLASLYLDSADLRLCRQTLEAEKKRFKLRIRRYGDSAEEFAYFEIKRRVDQVLLKQRARVAADRVAYLLDGSAPRSDDTTNVQCLSAFQRLSAQVQARPTALVRYWREAYESAFEEPLRITFDRGLSYQLSSGPDITISGSGWHETRIEGVILEIKFTARYPVWVERMIRQFNLKCRSIPKYVLSMRQAGLVDARYRVDGWELGG